MSKLCHQKRFLCILCVVCILLAFVGCAGKKTEIDPDANRIGSEVSVCEGVTFSVVVFMESTGSDYAKPDKGNIFDIVKIKINNDGDNAIVLNESDFSIRYLDQVLDPISGKLNFAPDKLPETVTIEPGTKYVSKLIWMVPKDSNLKLFVFKPSFGEGEIKYNLVQPEE